MRILIVSNMYPSKKSPYYGIFIKNTKDILERGHHNVRLVVMYKETKKVLKILKYILFYIKIVLYGLLFKYDIIYVHFVSHISLPILFLKKIRRNIVIYANVHGSDIVPVTRIQLLFQRYVKKILLISDKIITPSHYFRNLVIEKYHVDKEKIIVFPSGGIDKKKFYKNSDKGDCQKKLGLDTKYSYIGFVGRIDNNKGWDIFLKAIHILKNKDFWNGKKAIIVGNGKQINNLKELIDKLNLKNDIIYFDFFSQEQLVYVYNSMDVFCFPTRGESLGLVGLEAMACGIPVIGSNIGGLLDYLVDKKNGLLFQDGDYVDLSRKIEEYYKLEERQKILMSNECIQTAMTYERENIEQKFLEIFESGWEN